MMKKAVLAVISVTALVLSATPAPAFWWGGPPEAVVLNWPGYNVYPPGTTFQKQIVTCYYAHWYQAQVPTVVPRVTYKLETTAVKTYVNVPRVVEEPQTYTTYVPVQRLAQKQVTTCVMLPLFLPDAMGGMVVSCRPEIRTHTVYFPVQDLQEVTKQEMVKVTKMIPEERITQSQQIVPIVAYDQQMTSEWKVMMVPYQRVITVPVFDPHCPPQLFWP